MLPYTGQSCEFEQLLGLIADQAMPLIFDWHFLMCFWNTMILVWFWLYASFDFMHHLNMSLSGLCTSFSKVTEVFCGPKICNKYIGGRGSAPDPAEGAHYASRPPSRLGRGYSLSIAHPTRRLWRLDSRAFGARGLRRVDFWPQCKIISTRLATPTLFQWWVIVKTNLR